MSRPLISVVLPAFDAAPTITRAIQSIREQTLTEWELIVVDDGSTDATSAVVQELAREDHRIRLLKREHEGIVASLNAGLEQARAPLIARMDADDVSHPERLAEQAALLDQQPEIGLVSALVEFGGDRAEAGGYARHVDWMNTLVLPNDLSLNRFIESPLAHPSVMFRRELVTQYGAYHHGDFPEDYELWLRWADAGVQMAKVPQVLLTWNDPPKRLSRNDARYDFEAFYRCKAVYLARWLQRHVTPDRTLLIWGAGRPTRRRAEHLSLHRATIAGYIDIDPRKIGRRFNGRPVLAPEAIPAREACFILGYVAKYDARERARCHLRARGFVEGRDFLMAA